MRNDGLNKSSNKYGAIPKGNFVVVDAKAEFLANAATTSGDATLTMDSEAEIFVGSTIAGAGITPGTVVSSINTGTAGSNVTSVEMSNTAIATGSSLGTIQVGASHLKADDSGKTILVPALDADHHFVLPEVEDGLYYRFVYVGGAEDTEDWHFKTRSADNYFVGGLVHDDDDGNLIDIEYSDGNSNAHLNLLTPDAGTSIEFWCDGTLWYITGRIVADANDAITFADLA
tara:strand:- start:41 stop:730 length:690 start_codon:yes stop_codon:yes gene_type:complete